MSEESEQESENIKQLRAKAEEAKAVPELMKKLAFTEAGIPYKTGQGALLFKVYDGELTEAAIKAAAAEYQINVGTTEPSTPVENASDPAEQQALEQMQSASQSNDQQSEGLGPDPWQKARDAMEASKKSGEPIEWQHAAALSQIVAADNRNDPRVKGKSVDSEVIARVS